MTASRNVTFVLVQLVNAIQNVLPMIYKCQHLLLLAFYHLNQVAVQPVTFTLLQ